LVLTDGVPGTWFMSSTLRWQELPDVVEVDGYFPPQQGSDPLGCHCEHNLCSSCELPCSRIEGYVRRQQQGSQLLVSCLCQSEFDKVQTEDLACRIWE
jgi:hypothetical protein